MDWCGVFWYDNNMEENKEDKEKQLIESISDLAKVVETLRLKLVDKPKKFMFYNFISGIAGGLGTAIGASIVFALIIWLLSKMQLVPVLGEWAVKILNYVQQARVR